VDGSAGRAARQEYRIDADAWYSGTLNAIVHGFE
jgi:hypothetical protein